MSNGNSDSRERRPAFSDDYVDIDSCIDELDLGEEKSTENSKNKNRIQFIIGIKNTKSDNSDEELNYDDINPEFIQYYVKWQNKSFIHCSWLTEIQVVYTPGGEIALRKFKGKCKDVLHKSDCIKDLYVPSINYLNTDFLEVDKIIHTRNSMYLVKWKSMEYDESTWEKKDDIPNFDSCFDEYKKRKEHVNPKKFDPKICIPDSSTFSPIKELAPLSDGSTLRDYQLEGVNWLLHCWYEKRNSILADEMGLGKTIQTVVTLAKINEISDIHGPFLIIAPLSTLHQWKQEIEKWSTLYAVVYHGSPQSRHIISKYEFATEPKNDKKVAFDVVITNYELFT